MNVALFPGVSHSLATIYAHAIQCLSGTLQVNLLDRPQQLYFVMQYEFTNT